MHESSDKDNERRRKLQESNEESKEHENGKELLSEASLDAQRLGKNRPSCDNNPKGKKEKTRTDGNSGPALLRGQGVPGNAQWPGENKVIKEKCW